MDNFEEIAEQCLAGKTKGVFIFDNGLWLPSDKLIRNASGLTPYGFSTTRTGWYATFYKNGTTDYSEGFNIVGFKKYNEIAFEGDENRYT